MCMIVLSGLLCGCGNVPADSTASSPDGAGYGAQPIVTREPAGTPAAGSASPGWENGSGDTPDPSAQISPAPTAASEPTAASGPTATPTSALPQAGLCSLENLIATALEPVGSTMYVWGGGWNEADTGAGPEALSIGCGENWAKFADAQDAGYNYQDYRYRIHDGLDCSGYIGWMLYNVFHTENSQLESDGYVMKSTAMSETLAGYGWGELIPASGAVNRKPGDICSMPGHVWLSLGMCQDGSVLLLHSSPPGVRICGTLSEEGENTEAVALAEKWMSECYPEWYARYPACGVSYSYLTDSCLMRWNSDTLADAEELQALTAEEIAEKFMAAVSRTP